MSPTAKCLTLALIVATAVAKNLEKDENPFDF